LQVASTVPETGRPARTGSADSFTDSIAMGSSGLGQVGPAAGTFAAESTPMAISATATAATPVVKTFDPPLTSAAFRTGSLDALRRTFENIPLGAGSSAIRS
jgi:hypothetical protein